MDKIFEKGIKILDQKYMGTPISLYTKAIFNLSVGEIVEGKVKKIEKEGVYLNLKDNLEGFIPRGELSNKNFGEIEEIVKPGDEIKSYVLEINEKEGKIILSKKRADEEIAWKEIEKIYQEQRVISVKVEKIVKGGVLTSIFELPAFIPASLLELFKAEDLNSYLNRELETKIIELNRENKKIVLSRKIVLEEREKKRKDELFSSLKEGEIREGKVVRIVPFGIFVDLGGIDGLVHISEISWARVNHPSEAVKEEEIVKVKVLKVDKNSQKVSLSIKQTIPDPWKDIENKFKVGEIVKGKIMRILNFGAFVKIDDQLEGLVPLNELSEKKFSKPEEVISAGSEIFVKILSINKKERKISLSIKQVEQEIEKQRYQEYLLNKPKEEETPVMLEAFKEAMKEKEK
jgi:4-hydroxy-3-methylbut-2-enyl diphosphate reductase